MPSTAQAGVASLFGGIARGISEAATQRQQVKQQQKDSQLKIMSEAIQEGLKNGTLKNPYESMAYLMKQYGVKDSDGRIRNLMEQASTLIPQQFGHLDLPSTSIGITDPSTGQAGPAASGRAASPGTSVAMKSPVQATPGPPQFMTPDEVDQRDLSRQQKLSDIELKRQKELEQMKLDAAAANTTLGAERGEITFDGKNGPEGGLDVTGQPMVEGKAYGIHQTKSGRIEYVPKAPKADNSPLGREIALNRAAGMDEETARKTAADTLRKNEQNQFLIKTLQAKTAQAKLDLLEQTMPLTVQQKKNQVESERLLNATRDAMLSGDAKIQMDLATKQAAKLVTEKGGEYYGHSANEVTDIVLHKMGFDPDQTRERIKSQSATSQLLGDSVGGSTPAATPPKYPTLKGATNDNVPAPVLEILKGQALDADHDVQGPNGIETFHIAKDGTVSRVKSKKQAA